MLKTAFLLSSQQENNRSTMEFHGVDSWSCSMNCALWNSRDRWQLNRNGYDKFWNLMTMRIQMWFHVTSKPLNLRDVRRPETQSNDNILSLKYLGNADGNYRFSFTLQNTGDWGKVLECLFSLVLYIWKIYQLGYRRRQKFSWHRLSGALRAWEAGV